MSERDVAATVRRANADRASLHLAAEFTFFSKLSLCVVGIDGVSG